MANLTYWRVYNNRSFGQVFQRRHHRTRLHKTKVIIIGKCFNHRICPRFRSDWCRDTSDSRCLRRKMKMQDSHDMSYTSNSWIMSSIARHMNTMTRHSCTHRTLTTKCTWYLVWKPSSRISRPLCEPGLILRKELLFLDQISQWLGVLREIIWGEDSKSSKHTTLRMCLNDLVFPERERNKTFTYSWWQECT